MLQAAQINCWFFNVFPNSDQQGYPWIDIISEGGGKGNLYFTISEEHCYIIPNFTYFPLWGILHLISKGKRGLCGHLCKLEK